MAPAPAGGGGGGGGGSAGSTVSFKQPCTHVGEAMPDIAGIGVLFSFAAQAFMSLSLAVFIFFMSEAGSLDAVRHAPGSEERRRQEKRIRTFTGMLLTGNDIQVLLGIAYMITAWINRYEIGLYHLRLAYDTVSFVGVSCTTVLVCLAFCHVRLNKPLSRLSWRYLSIYVYAAFFLALSIVLFVHLENWDTQTEEAGWCYVTHGISHPVAGHPLSDQMYVGFTTAWMMTAMAIGLFVGPSKRKIVLVFDILQYPVHLYFMIAVRHVNQPYLHGKEKEDHWDFGQTTAMALLLYGFAELAEKIWAYRKWKQEITRRSASEELNRSNRFSSSSSRSSAGTIVGAGVNGRMPAAHVADFQRLSVNEKEFDMRSLVELVPDHRPDSVLRPARRRW